MKYLMTTNKMLPSVRFISIFIKIIDIFEALVYIFSFGYITFCITDYFRYWHLKRGFKLSKDKKNV